MNTPRGQMTVIDAEGVLSLVPHMLGFHPRESLVLLIMEQKSLEATLRVDLPDARVGRDAIRRFSTHLIGYMRSAPNADGACLVLYSDEVHPPGRQLPYREFVDTLGGELKRNGYQIPDAWLVGAERWWSYYCADVSCCPPSGRPIAPVFLSDAHLRLVVEGSSPLEKPWDGTAAGVWPGVESVRQVVDELRATGTTWKQTVRGLEQWCAALEQPPTELLDRLRGNPSDTGALLAALELDIVRDALPFAAGASSTAARHALVGQLRDVGARAELRQLGEFMLGNSDAAPHWETLERLWELGRGLLPAAQGRSRCALLCILGWIEWAKGHSSGAHALIGTCRGEDPGYRLAGLLDAFLSRGRLPLWATNRKTAWTGRVDA